MSSVSLFNFLGKALSLIPFFPNVHFFLHLLVLFYEDMLWLLRQKNLRKPVVLVGAACTSMLMGIMLLDKLLHQSFHTSPLKAKSSPCSNISKYPSYVKLRKHEASRTLKGSVFKKLDVVFLGSNSPIEDRFSVGTSSNLDAALFSIIDGHKGTHCAHYLQRNLNQQVSQDLHGSLEMKDDFNKIMDMDTVFNSLARGEKGQGEGLGVNVPPPNTKSNIASAVLKECLRKSFVSLDKEVSESALKEVKQIISGRPITEDMKFRILTALEGACALTALVRRDSVTIASTGDCRVVLGHKASPRDEWGATALTVDQNAHNAEEVRRLRSAHPGEEENLIVAERVLGSLMPFRTFGDVDYKWEKKYLSPLVMVLPNYHTPPYITAEPVLSQHQLVEGDRFLIVASDGLWERVSNEEAVNIVGKLVGSSCSNRKPSSLQSDSNTSPCCDGNAATHLLWHALGGSESSVAELLQLSPTVSRMYRDDITIMVVYL